jgi:hypothetical protein
LFNDELRNIWKGSGRGLFRLLSSHFPEGNEDYNKKISDKILFSDQDSKPTAAEYKFADLPLDRVFVLVVLVTLIIIVTAAYRLTD